jgi:hypothetical protein
MILLFATSSLPSWVQALAALLGILFIVGATRFGKKRGRGHEWLGASTAYPDGKQVRQFRPNEVLLFCVVVLVVGGGCIWALFRFFA